MVDIDSKISLNFLVLSMGRGCGEILEGAFDGKFRANGPWLSLIEKTTLDTGN